jgi:hypothetical protein
MTRIWLATASQLRGELKLIFKRHGWSGTWENLRRNPRDSQAALDFFVAQLRHTGGQRRTELRTIRPVGLPESSLRRLRRARKEQGTRARVSDAERFIVQHWLELPHGLPGLCFFSDIALESLFEVFGLAAGAGGATKQLRERLGLVQAGVRRHFVEDVVGIGSRLTFTGDGGNSRCSFEGAISWGNLHIWPPS